MFFFFKQKTAYEMRISDWSSDVCSSDLAATPIWVVVISGGSRPMFSKDLEYTIGQCYKHAREARDEYMTVEHLLLALLDNPSAEAVLKATGADFHRLRGDLEQAIASSVSRLRAEEHTAELQSIMRISYAVFCLKKKNKHTYRTTTNINISKNSK